MFPSNSAPNEGAALPTLVSPEPQDVFSIGPSTNGSSLWNVAACHVTYVGKTVFEAEMASLSQEEKTLFFMRLDELDELALENDQEVTYNSFSNGKHLSSSDISYSGTTSSQQKAAKPQIRTARVSKTTRSGSFAAPLKRKMSSPTSSRESRSGKASTKQLKKQRNKRSLQLQPEDAQIFRGLTFCKISWLHCHILAI